MSTRFTSVVTALAALGAVTLAGCSNSPVNSSPASVRPSSTQASSAQPSSARRPSGGPSTSDSARPPAGSTPPSTSDGRRAGVPAAQLKTADAPKTAPTGIWLADGGRTLHISAGEAACSTLRARVLSQGSEVHIDLHAQLKKTLAACPDHVTVRSVTAKLAAPLGKRIVVFTESQR